MKKQISFFLMFASAALLQAQPKLAAITFQGGTNTSGTVIQYTAGDTSLSVYYNLPVNACSSCGYGPEGSLIKARNGLMYGMTNNDGAYGAGTLFQYDFTSNTYTPMVSFDTSAGGGYPQGSLLQASNGLLYGLTSLGGANNSGTLFSYNIGADSIIKLADMPLVFQSIRLNSLIQSSNGKLYGMTDYDGNDFGGTIFEYDINAGTYTIVYNLPTYSNPDGDLLEVGTDTFYGLTLAGGATDDGMIFRFVPATDSFTVLYNFDAAHGQGPESSLIRASNGKLYGTTSMGGALANGVLFSFDPVSLVYTDLYNFATTGGFAPQGSPFQASDGMLYGMTVSGGESGNGTIYRYDISTGLMTFPLSFNYTDGSGPTGHFIQYGSALNITRLPASEGVCANNSAVFVSDATGDTAVQWQVSSNGGATFSNIAGATDSIYSFTATSAQNGNKYRAIFSNGWGSDTSTAATLTVNAAIDNISASVCPGQGYSLGGREYFSAGTYSDTVPGGSVFGCDSIVILNLSVNQLNDSATVSGAVCTALQNGATYQWQDCTGKLTIAGATSQSFTALVNGDYRCIVTMGSCVDTTNCVTVTGVGISEIGDWRFALYPNPVNSTFTIDNNYPGPMTAELTSMIGDKLKEYAVNKAHQTFDISDIPAGVYVVRFGNGEQTLKVMKVVKE